MSGNTPIVIWDVWVRLFHWSLAIAVLLLLYTGLTGELFYEWHKLAGEFVLLLIVFRACWGILGSSNARLSRLVSNPVRALKHFKHLFNRNLPQERGHNAAGAWAVVLMILMLALQAGTGLFIADEDEFVEGALYATVSSDWSDLMYTIHHYNAEVIKAVVILHVVMVIFYWAYARCNLIWPMITGKMNWTDEQQPVSVRFQRNRVGMFCFLICLLAVGTLVNWFGF